MGRLQGCCHHLLVHDGVSIIKNIRARRHEGGNKNVYGFRNKNVQNNYCYYFKKLVLKVVDLVLQVSTMHLEIRLRVIRMRSIKKYAFY